jgi:uncharacterized membrane protein
MNSFLYALPSIFLIGFANVLLKWRLDYLSKIYGGILGKYCLRFAIDPFILVGALATAISILWWLSIMPKVKVSIVYPIIQAGVIIVTVALSSVFLHERLNPGQALGIMFLISGVLIASFSS